jgi:hypothetical protein
MRRWNGQKGGLSMEAAVDEQRITAQPSSYAMMGNFAEATGRYRSDRSAALVKRNFPGNCGSCDFCYPKTDRRLDRSDAQKFSLLHPFSQRGRGFEVGRTIRCCAGTLKAGGLSKWTHDWLENWHRLKDREVFEEWRRMGWTINAALHLWIVEATDGYSVR